MAARAGLSAAGAKATQSSFAEEFDLLAIDDAFVADPYPTYARLQRESPVHQNSDGTYFLTRYEDVAWVLKEPRMSSDKTRELTGIFGDCPLLEHYLHLMVFRDPPKHTRIRSVFAHAFTPKAVRMWEPIVEQAVDDTLEAAIQNGSMDLIRDFAYVLPINVIARMLGVPKVDVDLFRRWSRGVTATLDPRVRPEDIDEGNAVVEEFKAYMADLAASKRKKPGDDLMSLLVTAQKDDSSITDLDLAHNATFLLNAGHETTSNLIGNAVSALFAQPDQLERLRSNPSLFATAVEEFLRYDSPNQLGGRRVTEDVDLRGTKIPANTYIWITNGGANRDPEEFNDPNTLDVGRQPNRHVAFGHGIHVCLGAALGRFEGGIALRRLICDHPNLAPNGEPERRMVARYRGFTSFPVTVH